MELDERHLDDFPEQERSSTSRFFLRMGSGTNFLQVFKGLAISSSSLVLFVAGGEGNVDGISIMSEYEKCIQGCCRFPKSCFEEAIIPESVFKFAVAASDLQEAIQLMPNSPVELSMIDEGDPLCVRMAQDDVLAEVVIQVFDHDNALEFDFDRQQRPSRVVLDSAMLKLPGASILPLNFEVSFYLQFFVSFMYMLSLKSSFRCPNNVVLLNRQQKLLSSA